MATDYENTLQHLTSLGISFEELPFEREKVFYSREQALKYKDTYKDASKQIIITVNHKEVIGYTSFCTEYFFNDEGKFVVLGIWG